jgi:uncharacterized protein (TIGR03067 family)
MTACTLFAALLVAAPAVKAKPAPADMVPTGEWVAEKLEHMGNDLLKGGIGPLTLNFPNQSVVVRIGTNLELTFQATFDPTARPKEITVTPDRSGDGHLIGIYKIEGDTLTICLGDKVDSPRPKEFKADSPDVGLIVLKRAKK